MTGSVSDAISTACAVGDTPPHVDRRLVVTKWRDNRPTAEAIPACTADQAFAIYLRCLRSNPTVTVVRAVAAEVEA